MDISVRVDACRVLISCFEHGDISLRDRVVQRLIQEPKFEPKADARKSLFECIGKIDPDGIELIQTVAATISWRGPTDFDLSLADAVVRRLSTCEMTKTEEIFMELRGRSDSFSMAWLLTGFMRGDSVRGLLVAGRISTPGDWSAMARCSSLSREEKITFVKAVDGFLSSVGLAASAFDDVVELLSRLVTFNEDSGVKASLESFPAKLPALVKVYHADSRNNTTTRDTLERLLSIYFSGSFTFFTVENTDFPPASSLVLRSFARVVLSGAQVPPESMSHHLKLIDLLLRAPNPVESKAASATVDAALHLIKQAEISDEIVRDVSKIARRAWESCLIADRARIREGYESGVRKVLEERYGTRGFMKALANPAWLWERRDVPWKDAKREMEGVMTLLAASEVVSV